MKHRTWLILSVLIISVLLTTMCAARAAPAEAAAPADEARRRSQPQARRGSCGRRGSPGGRNGRRRRTAHDLVRPTATKMWSCATCWTASKPITPTSMWSWTQSPTSHSGEPAHSVGGRRRARHGARHRPGRSGRVLSGHAPLSERPSLLGRELWPLPGLAAPPGDEEAINGFMTQLTITGPFINRTLFEQAGVQVPSDASDEVTWEEWAEAAVRSARRSTLICPWPWIAAVTVWLVRRSAWAPSSSTPMATP